ncbi:MAG: cyclic nucleotide-binding domain-containing protein, partial [Lachnospiraceae bacterium]|nr:cyclic nucleotide-binding domain-containing protein [Lachnospiraceae bacterium]
MGQGTLYEEFPFLKDVGKERQKQFEEYFKSAPPWLMDALQTEELKKGTVFIREGEPAETIFFLVKGIIGATDYRIYGTPYDFMQFDKAYAFGGMEFIMDYELYRTPMSTMTNCTVVKISRTIFEKWMY